MRPDEIGAWPSVTRRSTRTTSKPADRPNASIASGVPARSRPNADSGLMTSARTRICGAMARRNSSGVKARRLLSNRSGTATSILASVSLRMFSCKGASRATSVPGRTTSSGCGSKTRATAFKPRCRAACTVASTSARWPRWTPSKTPMHTAASPTSGSSWMAIARSPLIPARHRSPSRA